MSTGKLIFISVLLASVVFSVKAEQSSTSKPIDVKKTKENAKKTADVKAEMELDQFGFGPAFYVINYKDEVLSDSKDITIKGDNTISTKSTKYSTTMGLELHYDFSFGRTVKCFNTEDKCNDAANYELTTAHRLSPFLGLYDLDNGINGIAVGLVYGYIKKHKNDKKPVTLNTGIGWTVHKDRLVLGDGLSKGAVPPVGINVEDYTDRKDVKGITLMISINMGF